MAIGRYRSGSLRALSVMLTTALAISGLCARAGAQVCTERVLLTATEDGALVREVRIEDQKIIRTHIVDFPNGVAIGVSGIAVHPMTGEIFLLVKTAQFPQIPFLVTYDLETDTIISVIGSTVLDFGDLTFDDSGILYAVSSEAANPPNAFCELDQQTGSPIDICALGAGDDGEALAFNPADAQIYHASGVQDVIFEVISDPGVNRCGTTPIPIAGGGLEGDAVTAIAWEPESAAFLWKQGIAEGPIFQVTASGAATELGTIDHSVSDFTAAEVIVVCPTDPEFKRGDADGNGDVSGLVDGVFILSFQFMPGSAIPPCLDAADVDNNGSIQGIVDGLSILNFQFMPGSPAPPNPGPFRCGPDPAGSSIGCRTAPPC